MTETPDSGLVSVLQRLGFRDFGTGFAFERSDGERCVVSTEAGLPVDGAPIDVAFYRGTDVYALERFVPGQQGRAVAKIAVWQRGAAK